MVYKIFNIEWDDNGDQVRLPNEVLFKRDSKYNIEKLGKHELCFEVGYPVKKFSYKVL